MTADTLVEARWVIPVIPRNTVLENHTVVFSGSRIADILPTEAARVRYAGLEAKTMRLPAGVVMPGLINLHTHAAMNLLRGRGADLPLMDWLTKEIWPAEGRLMSAEFVHDGSLIAGVEMIRSGVTCCSDLYFFPEAAAEGLREAGLRCATAGIVIGFPSAWAANDDEYISKCEALIERYSGDPFVRVTVGPHAPYTVSDASLEEIGSEVRVTVPGHTQRGGEPCPYDRVLSTRIGAGAAQAIMDGEYGIMIGVVNGKIKRVPLEECAGKLKMVSPKDQLVVAAKQIGISFGDQ